MKLRELPGKIWRRATRPWAYFSLRFLSIAAFVLGILFWGGFNTAMELTNTEKFCISCHEMRVNVFAELQHTVHYSNRSGVRATCPDCHVPYEWGDKIVRKIQASRELWGWAIGSIDTREKFQAQRRKLAMREWARFKANDSLECRNCHDFESMDFSVQSPRAAAAHAAALGPDGPGNLTCIDCHKGIAHELPDMRGVDGW